MADHTQQRIKEVFQGASQREPSERPAYLDEACGGDLTLRSAVESLLAAAERAGSFLESSPRPSSWVPKSEQPPGLQSTLTQDSRPFEPSQVIDRYRLLEKLGEGGMGEVWLAEQQAPLRRRVALKLIKAGMDTAQVMARFEAERQALALMEHPAIAKVFDAGATAAGRPYFVMEYVAGLPITQHCDDQRLTTGGRLELFLQVCEGVQHAHQKAVLHRDLKPTNVLVVSHDGRATPKIIDFGLAKAMSQPLTARTLYTGLEMVIGTPGYMSPEQADRTGRNLDARTDVYSLGVMLYELLVGVPPFDQQRLRQAGWEGLGRLLREEEPATPSKRLSLLSPAASAESAGHRRADVPALRRQLSGDLDWITMKAIEPDRERRYGSPAELAEEIRRHLRDEPVLAGPPSRTYRMRKFARRHRTAVAAACVLMLALGAGFMGTTLARVARSLVGPQVDPRTILILPMEVRGEGEGADYAGRAFSQTLAVDLARAAELTILPVPQADEITTSPGEAAGVKAALGAGAGRLISGELTREGGALTASVSLMDTARNRVIWGQRKEAEGLSLSSLASSLTSDLLAQLGVRPPRQYGHYAYSTSSPALAASAEWMEAIKAVRAYDISAALKATERLVERFPAEPDSHVLRTSALLFEAWGLPLTQRFEASLAAIDRADPNNPWDEVLGAYARGQRGKHREAVEELTAVLSRGDLSPAARAFVLSLRGDQRTIIDDYAPAFADFEMALELDPANDVNYLTLAAALLRTGRIEEGLTHARRAVALTPTSAPNNHQLGRALQMMGRYEEALVPMRTACEGQRVYCVHYGNVLSLAGHPEEALPRLAELCASDAQDCIEYACALARAGRAREAHAAARKAEGPESAWLLHGMARIAALTGDRARAIQLLSRSIKLGIVYGRIDQEPDFLSLHDLPEFQTLASEVEERLRVR